MAMYHSCTLRKEHIVLLLREQAAAVQRNAQRALYFFTRSCSTARARSRSRNNTAPEKGAPSSEQQRRPSKGVRVSAISRRHENTTVVRHALGITANPPRTQSTARSDSNTGHQWHSAVPLQCCGNCQHQRLCNSCFTACRRQCLRNYWP
ncbi:uncharacterized protein LOC142565789 [Dermacentor variabilis]|uniref:uncharacterized protein LOC142565789 n=1 Tax=Dermacentor variabilis TaxID=34621 RepID=UPI003F5CA947